MIAWGMETIMVAFTNQWLILTMDGFNWIARREKIMEGNDPHIVFKVTIAPLPFSMVKD
jgi:hypothetical protein